MLRTKFLESKYDYLIMCDDDIVLEQKIKDAPKKYLAELDKHPEGFSFVRYGWSLTFCAVSRFIYSKEDMCDVDPEKSEGYEDMVFPMLLHYKYPDKEFKTGHILMFHQQEAKFRDGHKSTWMAKDIQYNEIQDNTNTYINNFKAGNFDIPKIKAEIVKWKEEKKKLAENNITGRKGCYLYF